MQFKQTLFHSLTDLVSYLRKKKRDFSKFKQIAKLIQNEDHLTIEGIQKILEIRKEMNDGGNRKYSDEEILRILRDYMPNT